MRDRDAPTDLDQWKSNPDTVRIENANDRSHSNGRLVVVLAETLKSQAAGSQSSHWFNQMDRDGSGSVSKTEFVQFMSHGTNRVDVRLMRLRFNRLDTNHIGGLERNDLRLFAAKWFPHHHR
jgi:Ca2+-binding EF-hand superfamily protein